MFPGLLSRSPDAEEEEELDGAAEEREEPIQVEPLSPLELCVLQLSLLCRYVHMSHMTNMFFWGVAPLTQKKWFVSQFSQ